jgi:hypothetical protein
MKKSKKKKKQNKALSHVPKCKVVTSYTLDTFSISFECKPKHLSHMLRAFPFLRSIRAAIREGEHRVTNVLP